MAMLGRHPALAVMAVFAIQASSVQFNSTTYPYSIQQSGAYRHVVITTDRKVDYFFPNLGSYTTSVNIYAEPGHTMTSDSDFLHAFGGQSVRRDGSITILGKKMTFTRADFKAVAGHWTEERVSFVAENMVWHLTMSYDVKFRSARRVMLHMLESFQLRRVGRHRH
jgi:hypothetical protein